MWEILSCRKLCMTVHCVWVQLGVEQLKQFFHRCASLHILTFLCARKLWRMLQPSRPDLMQEEHAAQLELVAFAASTELRSLQGAS